MSHPPNPAVIQRAQDSHGISHDAIYASIAREVAKLPLPRESVVLDIGCGRGYLWGALKPYFKSYVGVDVMRHVDFPEDQQLVLHDVVQPGIPLPDHLAEVVITCEVMPCVENPRLLMRECARLCKPGGWIIAHAPNLLSWFNLMAVLLKGQHRFFPDAAASFMITPLLEADLLRMAAANGLTDARLFYTRQCRVPGIHRNLPRMISRMFPRRCSDHLGMIARKPATSV